MTNPEVENMEVTDIEDLIPEEIGGLCGMITPIVGYLLIGISIIANREWFTWADHALSDLGGPAASYPNIFNVGLIVTGVLGLIFALSIYRMVEENIGFLGVSLFSASTVFLILTGLFPTGRAPHFFVSVAFFALAAAGMWVIGLDQLMDVAEPVWGIFLISSVLLTIAAIWLVFSIPYDLGYAIPEFIATTPIMLFSLVWGARLYFV